MSDFITCIIVDDEQDAIDLLTDRIGRLRMNIEVTGTYLHWKAALDALQEDSADLLFLDISMPVKNGFELLKLLPGLKSEIIFVTAYEQYMTDARSIPVRGYLLKPIDDKALAVAVSKALTLVRNKKRKK